MIQKDLSWKSKDGLTFFAHTWEPDDKPKASITLVHGFGEHCLRYTPYIELFTNSGFAVLGFDLRGHGQSGGKRGVINSYDGLLDDIEIALITTGELYPNIPHFIYGHSMGGNLALNLLLRRPHKLNGGIITSPWLKLTNEPNAILKTIVSVLQFILPNITINSGLESDGISSVKTEVEEYDNDPLNHGRISFRLLFEISKSGLWAIKNSNKLKIPILLMHGTADKITAPKASKEAKENNPEMIDLIEWEGKYHELHNESNRTEVAEVVINWLSRKL